MDSEIERERSVGPRIGSGMWTAFFETNVGFYCWLSLL